MQPWVRPLSQLVTQQVGKDCLYSSFITGACDTTYIDCEIQLVTTIIMRSVTHGKDTRGFVSRDCWMNSNSSTVGRQASLFSLSGTRCDALPRCACFYMYLYYVPTLLDRYMYMFDILRPFHSCYDTTTNNTLGCAHSV
jgi:hypothetical protein